MLMGPNDLIVRVAVALHRLHEDLGIDALEIAATKSLIGIAALRLDEVTARTSRQGKPTCQIVHLFPTAAPTTSRADDGPP